MVRHLIDLLIGAVVILAVLYVIYNPMAAFAADAPVCWPLDDAVTAAEDTGGRMIDLIDVDGQTVNQLLIAEVDGYIQMWGALDGCMIGRPIPLDTLKSKGQPA